MATEYLVPNGNDAGWDVSNHLNIDNGINGGTPDDGTVVSETAEGIELVLDLSDTAIDDADTVTNVNIRLRARTTGAGSDQCNVDFLIGGVPQGSTFNTGTLTASFVTYTALGATQSWNADYTAAQLNGATVVLTSTQVGKAQTLGLEVSEVEVEIIYTPASVAGVPFPSRVIAQAVKRTGNY